MDVQFQFGEGAQVAVAKVLNMLPWNWSGCFRTTTDTGTLARLTDIKSPLDKKTTIKVTLDKIANVYTTLADGQVPVSEQSSNTSGQTVFCELKTIATKTDGTTTKQLPMVSRIELRLPNDPDITELTVQTLLLATYASLCDEDGNLQVIAEKMRGALTPVGV